MRKLKKAFFLTLALTLSLALAVPAFAAESNYKLEVSGKPNAYVGERTFTVRDWNLSDPYENEDGYSMVSLTKTDSHAYTVSNLYVVSKGDTMVFTKGGEEFHFFGLEAWSDPEGDGVYDGRVWSFEEDYVLWPADTAGPLHVTASGMNDQFYLNHWPDGSGISYDMPYMDSNYKLVETTAAKLSADTLLEMFGPNTLVVVSGDDWSCAILVGNTSQPTTPSQPEQPAGVKTANPTNDKLMVNGAEQSPTVYKIGGSNYFKIRDVAAVLNGTGKQFAVGYSGGKVTVTSGQPYEATGKELAGAPDSARDASRSNDSIVIDGTEASLTVYKIGGSNYFKLRDLGKALDFYVGYEGGKVTIDTGRSYAK